MARPQLNYFVCTLGEAAKWNGQHPHPFHTVNDLIDEQAKSVPHQPAVCLFGYSESGKDFKSDFTYKELRDYSVFAATRLRRRMQVALRGHSSTVGLLCNSTPAFILTWLGLMRLGMSVLILAPQLEASAIQHLCSTCNVAVIFADARNQSKTNSLHDFLILNLSNILHNLPGEIDSQPTLEHIPNSNTPTDMAFLFHTSGTSSGLPKPIPQTHHAAVGVLPSLPGGNDHASTFSTTPLYHGGIADCFRAWTSGALVYLFPGTQPITASNIKKCIGRASSSWGGLYPVNYFTCVPYILQMLAEDDDGKKLLRNMDLVGVGGAALPRAVGDELVNDGVNLVSRFGSAECGFLLSSHRDYSTDREWQYFRAREPKDTRTPDFYEFEPSEDGLAELVIKPGWPHLGKTNREDGSFATADLFEPHPGIPNAWRYHSRADAQITLVNGKKFDPAPVEVAILADETVKKVLRDVMVFGTGRERPGALLFPVDGMAPREVLGLAWPTIDRMNRETQTHARLYMDALVVVAGSDNEDAPELPKSSKGTILRRQAETQFAEGIESVYKNSSSRRPSPQGHVPDDKVLPVLENIFKEVLGRHIDARHDLYGQGVDSVACTRVRNMINNTFFADSGVALPLNVIYDQGSVDKLAHFILHFRKSGDVVSTGNADEEKLMLELVRKYRTPTTSPRSSTDHPTDRVVVLTGATGSLGAHILDLLQVDMAVKKIYCLLRASTPHEAHERAHKGLRHRRLQGLEEGTETKVICVPCTLSEPKLGLSELDWDDMANEATHIIHSAWSVNFSLNLGSFEDHLAGTRHILELRNATKDAAARLIFISSTASVSSSNCDQPIPEMLSPDPRDASPLGYSRSKWVAEHICSSPRERLTGKATEEAKTVHFSPDDNEDISPVVIIRVGQCCGNRHGIWNAGEAYPIMLSSAQITGCLPDLEDECLDWLPVDMASRSVLEIAFADTYTHISARQGAPLPPIYHVANPHRTPTWSEMLEWIRQYQSETKQQVFTIVSPAQWSMTLENALGSEMNRHPAQALLHLWKDTYSAVNGDASGQGQRRAKPLFETRRTDVVSKTMRTVKPLGKDDTSRMWGWIQTNVWRERSLGE